MVIALGHQEELQKKQRAYLWTDAEMSQVLKAGAVAHVSVSIGAET